eukprot:g4668.t1
MLITPLPKEENAAACLEAFKENNQLLEYINEKLIANQGFDELGGALRIVERLDLKGSLEAVAKLNKCEKNIQMEYTLLRRNIIDRMAKLQPFNYKMKQLQRRVQFAKDSVMSMKDVRLYMTIDMKAMRKKFERRRHEGIGYPSQLGEEKLNKNMNRRDIEMLVSEISKVRDNIVKKINNPSLVKQKENIIKKETPSRYSYIFIRNFSPFERSIGLRVRAHDNVHLALSSDPSHNSAKYEIFIGKSKSTIRAPNHRSPKLIEVGGKRLDGDKFSDFWISWENEIIVGEGKTVGENCFMKINKIKGVVINCFLVSTGGGSQGTFHINVESSILRRNSLQSSYLQALEKCTDLLDSAKELLQVKSSSAYATTAYLKNINMKDEEVTLHWMRQHPIHPAYRKAFDQVCLEREWFTDTKLLRHIRQATKLFKKDLQVLRKSGGQGYERALVAAIRKGYNLSDDNKARTQRDLLSGQSVFGQCKKVYNSLEGWKKPYMAHAIKLLAELEGDRGAIIAKLGEICDRAMHCRQVQVKSFNLMISHAYSMVLSLDNQTSQKQEKVMLDDLSVFDNAILRFYEIMEDFIDDFKEKAFSSAFMEPARFYFVATNRNDWRAHNVDTHANNWYLSLLNATVNCHLPLIPAYWDNWPNSCAPFMEGLSEQAWEEFKKPENFGLSWQKVMMKKDKKKMVKNASLRHAEFPQGNTSAHLNPAKRFANDAVNPNGNRGVQDKLNSYYVDRFCYFFRRDFFVKKSFEKMNSEEKPEHSGFRKCVTTLYAVYRQEQLDDAHAPNDFLSYFYDESYHLDVKAVDRFFTWIGVVKPAPGTKLLGDKERQTRTFSSTPKISESREASPLSASTVKLESSLQKRLLQINEEMQKATKKRDLSRIRTLMTERNQVTSELKLKQAEAEEKEEEKKGRKRRVSENNSGKLKEVQSELQQAMRDRDTKKIRALMVERNRLLSVMAGAKTGGDVDINTEESKNENAVPAPPAPLTLEERNSSLNEEEDFTLQKEIVQFLDNFLRVFAEASSKDPQFRAAVFERWQMFEMQYENVKVIRRSATLLANDERFLRVLRESLTSKVDTIRDMAGIVFRVHCMIVDNELPRVTGLAKQLIADAVEAIIAPFEGKKSSVDGHFVGALYMQCVAPYLCALRSNTSVIAISDLVRRCAGACVNWYVNRGKKSSDKPKVKASVVELYLNMIRTGVYGSEEEDIFFQTFYK